MPTITLLCLVSGEPADRIFPVDIDGNKTVGHLKEAIKGKLEHDFASVDAHALSVWRVNISGENLGDLRLDPGNKLKPSRKISFYFPEAELSTLDDSVNVNIIVQAPCRNG